MENTDLAYDVSDACPKRIREIRNDCHKQSQDDKFNKASSTCETEIKRTPKGDYSQDLFSEADGFEVATKLNLEKDANISYDVTDACPKEVRTIPVLSESDIRRETLNCTISSSTSNNNNDLTSNDACTFTKYV
ncbi:uncharacterized protein TNIN_494651 [Trichonephila inaurata madagascariensis]|uniref:Uncharacterized protein n=1 Tax=Trichonephila inaurata madagascariensis TaxID=2747483 RepID=A0A8X6XQV0_9ARAC|nr:uncharacterized protein TNIN_494651 [Trichonephila inaurata madagascariensis]